jgi:hypothetical protein
MTPTRKETMSIKIMMLIRSDVCDVPLFVCFFSLHGHYSNNS